MKVIDARPLLAQHRANQDFDFFNSISALLPDEPKNAKLIALFEHASQRRWYEYKRLLAEIFAAYPCNVVSDNGSELTSNTILN